MQEVTTLSVEFSAKISMLRKEKGITQRKAAEDLQISQALLSHYEKGIRECSLDFVRKAALYYGVTADFLLGITENKHTLNDVFAIDEIDSDTDLNAKSLARSILYLSEDAAAAGENLVEYYLNYFSLCVKRYICSVQGNTPKTRLCDFTLQLLADEQRIMRVQGNDFSEQSRALKTVLNNADELTDDIIENVNK